MPLAASFAATLTPLRLIATCLVSCAGTSELDESTSFYRLVEYSMDCDLSPYPLHAVELAQSMSQAGRDAASKEKHGV